MRSRGCPLISAVSAQVWRDAPAGIRLMSVTVTRDLRAAASDRAAPWASEPLLGMASSGVVDVEMCALMVILYAITPVH